MTCTRQRCSLASELFAFRLGRYMACPCKVGRLFSNATARGESRGKLLLPVSPEDKLPDPHAAALPARPPSGAAVGRRQTSCPRLPAAVALRCWRGLPPPPASTSSSVVHGRRSPWIKLLARPPASASSSLGRGRRSSSIRLPAAVCGRAAGHHRRRRPPTPPSARADGRDWTSCPQHCRRRRWPLPAPPSVAAAGCDQTSCPRS